MHQEVIRPGVALSLGGGRDGHFSVGKLLWTQHPNISSFRHTRPTSQEGSVAENSGGVRLGTRTDEKEAVPVRSE